MKKEIVKKIFNTFYPEIRVKNVEILPKNKFENGKWIPDNSAIFLIVHKTGYIDRTSCYEMSKTLTDFTGHEFDVSFDSMEYFN